MRQITTLTVNPAIDKSAKIDGLIPDIKQKCHSIKYHPGGGGINISRLLKNLATESNCVFTSGGYTGRYLQDLLSKENVQQTVVPITGLTRENFSVVDTNTQLQYRFGMPGCDINEVELAKIKEIVINKINSGDVLVLSGSLGNNMSSDFYAQLIRSVKNKNVKVVVDTSGQPLKDAVNEGVYLIKPNQKELAQLAGVEILNTSDQEKFAQEIVNSGKSEYVAVSLGSRGAFLVSKNGVIYQSTPSVIVKSTIGAGDSMVAGLVYGIINDFDEKNILKWGVACGVATTLTEGSHLASKADIEKIFKIIPLR